MCRRFDSAPATPLKRRRLQQILRQSGNVNSLWRVALRTAWWENYWDVTNSRRGNTGSSPSFGQFQLDLLRLSVVLADVGVRGVILAEDTSCKTDAPSILRCAQIRNRSLSTSTSTAPVSFEYKRIRSRPSSSASPEDAFWGLGNRTTLPSPVPNIRWRCT